MSEEPAPRVRCDASGRGDHCCVGHEREREVLGLIASGSSNIAIAKALHVTSRAVEKHINSIFTKLDLPVGDGTHRRVAAVLLYLGDSGSVPDGHGGHGSNGTHGTHGTPGSRGGQGGHGSPVA